MSVLIKGLKMPETEYVDVRIFRDGTATLATGKKPYYRELKAEPVRHGKWITEECLPGVAVCSICGHEIRGIGCQYTKYCDECGARMDEE